jgi:anti-anti-sigma regulatory factor
MAEATVQPDYKIGPEISEKISRLAMVGSENHAAKVASRLGFESFRGSGSKESKRTYIEERQKQGHSVVYVGDCDTESAAAEQADVAISVLDLSRHKQIDKFSIGLLFPDLVKILQLRTIVAGAVNEFKLGSGLSLAPNLAAVFGALTLGSPLVTAFAAILISIEDSILIGVAISLILFVPRVSKLGIRELIVTPERVVRERRPDEPRSNSLLIYDLEGELFFGAAPELDHYLEQIKQETISTGIKYVVLRLRRTRAPDVVAIEHLEHFLRDAEKRGVTVLLAGVRPDLAKILRNVHFNEWLPEDRIYPEKDEQFSATLNAVRHAYRLVNQERESEEADYYLV